MISFDELNVGDRIVVSANFEFDRAFFTEGMQGTIVNKIDESFRTREKFIAVEWDHEDRQQYHTCAGYAKPFRGFNLNPTECFIVKIEDWLNDPSKPKPNPLPEDPRLRGIALKIIQMESRFKAKQLEKLKQKKAKENDYEVHEDISIPTGVFVSQGTGSIS